MKQMSHQVHSIHPHHINLFRQCFTPSFVLVVHIVTLSLDSWVVQAEFTVFPLFSTAQVQKQGLVQCCYFRPKKAGHLCLRVLILIPNEFFLIHVKLQGTLGGERAMCCDAWITHLLSNWDRTVALTKYAGDQSTKLISPAKNGVPGLN